MLHAIVLRTRCSRSCGHVRLCVYCVYCVSCVSCVYCVYCVYCVHLCVLCALCAQHMCARGSCNCKQGNCCRLIQPGGSLLTHRSCHTLTRFVCSALIASSTAAMPAEWEPSPGLLAEYAASVPCSAAIAAASWGWRRVCVWAGALVTLSALDVTGCSNQSVSWCMHRRRQEVLRLRNRRCGTVLQL